MKISIFGKNIEVSEYLENIVNKKIRKLDKFFSDDTEAMVTLSVEHNRHIAEVTIPYDGGVIRAEEVTGDMYASIDNVINKIEKQVHRFRKRIEKDHRSGIFSEVEPDYEEDEDEGPRIVRIKHFDIKPMSEEEAMLQIELLCHSFYVFENAETGSINVLYRRNDGNYGLIEPTR